MKVISEGVRVLSTEVALDPPDGQVHLAQLPRGGVRFLAEDRQACTPSAMCLEKPDGLYEHAAGTKARVVDAAVERLDHFDQQPDDGLRRVELPPPLALTPPGAPHERLVHPPEPLPLPPLAPSPSHPSD